MNDNIKPTSIYVPGPVPIHQQEKVKEELDRMMSLNVIEEANSPTDWCSPMVVAIKGNGKIRICTDMTKFNKAVKREVYPMATVESSLAKIKGKIFSKLDANSGFWQIPLKESSQKLTTFLTPWGRFYYKQLPFGLTSAPEIFCREMDRILKDCKGVVIHMDDVLVMGENKEEHDTRLDAVLNKISKAGMTLNREKCSFGSIKVEFLGFKISGDGIQAGEKIQGNSVAERGVQTIKNILSKEDDPYLGLLAYRSTPLSFGISPAELLMGRRLNTTVPEIPKGLRRINQPKFIKFNKENKENNKKYRDNKYTIEKRELENNEEVFVKDLRKVAKIAYRSPESDRSYVLDTDKRFIRRNRQMIIPLKNTSYVTRSGRISKPPDRLIEIN